MKRYTFIIIGGGIVGCSTAYFIGKRFPKASVLLIEKEATPGQHQTSRNSGVIHSGVYYEPGSYKAKFAKEGSNSMVEFCREHNIDHQICGKLIVATDNTQIPILEKIYLRSIQNSITVEKLSPERVREIEPFVECVGGLHVKSTGITNYMDVCRKFIELIQEQGGHLEFSQEVKKIQTSGNIKAVITSKNEYEAGFIINCAGLHSDRVAQMTGADPGARIIPFRGEYYEIVESKRSLVNALVYPVPDPKFPFLGVHLTRMIDGSVHAGPNAVLAMKREGYKKLDFNAKDLYETVTYGAFWRLIGANIGEGMKELYRSIFKSEFVKSLQKLVPDLTIDDLVSCKSGVRAQALLNNGSMADDFLFIDGDKSLNVCNAPSPAATAAIEVGKAIVGRINHFK